MNENTVLVKKLRLGLQELNRLNSENKSSDDKFRLGQLLTIIDSAIADPEQRKATKDLIHNIWYTYAPSVSINTRSLEEQLFEALTGGPLYEQQNIEKVDSYAEYNSFEEKFK